MKIFCDIPLNVSDFSKSQFNWFKNDDKFLFALEDEKRLRLISITDDPPRDVQSASLADSRLCTSLSWSRDDSLLAIVVDKKQVYFWELKTNTFTHLRTSSSHHQSSINTDTMVVGDVKKSSSSVGGGRSGRARDIELVAWSKRSDKLAICYASGQILLCKFAHNCDSSEKFIDNSAGVLKRIVAIEACEHADLFACLSVSHELLVMTFDGQAKFYLQADSGFALRNIKFSPPTSSGSERPLPVADSAIWLAYQSEGLAGSGSKLNLLLKCISLEADCDKMSDSKEDLALLADASATRGLVSIDSELVDYSWLTGSHLLACHSGGEILLVQLAISPTSASASHQTYSLKRANAALFALTSQKILHITHEEETAATAEGVPATATEKSQEVPTDSESLIAKFKTFQLAKNNKSVAHNASIMGNANSCALVAASSYRLYYYELCYEFETNKWVPEQVDSLDLANCKQMNLRLERAVWAPDCAMLAVQLTNGHILLYRTRLQNYQVASYGSKTVYMSSESELTVLDYGLGDSSSLLPPSPHSIGDSHESSQVVAVRGDNALVLDVGFKPSVIAVGVGHLALALNNRVRFYASQDKTRSINDSNSDDDGKSQTAAYGEQEYMALVVGLSLSSRFVAVHFDDGRLKLHSISTTAATTNETTTSINERFFPDPSKADERVVAFTLTEQLLVYQSNSISINVFDLVTWAHVQHCDHARLFPALIAKFKPNQQGNKFICLPEPTPRTSVDLSAQPQSPPATAVFLYDLYTNKTLPLVDGQLWRQMSGCQWSESVDLLTMNPTASNNQLATELRKLNTPPRLNCRVPLDAFWDTDGRTLLLIEQKRVHIMAVLDHTLEREEPLAEYATSAPKQSTYKTLFASQGIVSFQTSLGRVINKVLETHDDELKLTKLEQSIRAINARSEQSANEDVNVLVDHIIVANLEIMRLKVAYLHTILPIYALPKCRDICEYLMSEQQFAGITSLTASKPLPERCLSRFNRCSRLINKIIWKQLAAWSIFTSNLNFALLIYRRHELRVQECVLLGIMADMRTKGMDSRQLVKSRLMKLLNLKVTTTPEDAEYNDDRL